MTDPISNERLLPCPFCGWSDTRLITGGSGNHYVRCDHCLASTDDGSKERAIAAWNRRQPPAGVEPVSDLIRQALREIDNVTAMNDQDANCLGCAENLLRQALSTLSPEGEPVAWLVERLHQGQVTSAEFTVISRYAQECLSAGSRVTPLYASPHELIEVTQEMVDAGYKAAEEVLRGTSADIGAGELDRLVRATLRAASPPGPAEVTDETVERLFQAAVPFMAGTAYRELRAALTAALKREGE